MIQCTPNGLCSWDFHLDGDGHRGSTEFHWMSEQGSIVADGEAFEVRKHGPFSGHWTLELAQGVHTTARKSSAFTRSFDLRGPRGALRLRAESAFGRAFHLERGDDTVAVIRPQHPMTRRATIEVLEDLEWPLTCFAFWLTVLTWRRSARRH